MNDEDKWVEEAFLQGQRYIAGLEEEIAELKAQYKVLMDDMYRRLNGRDIKIANLEAQVEQLRGFVQWVADREHMTVEVTPKMAREARAALAGNED
jgi:Asp-tRNA(Asn)/Glu-tRNA(Gln) amidotransferase B subunit